MNISNIEKPILVNNVLHVKDNIKILKHLFSQGHFQLDRTPLLNKKFLSEEDFLMQKIFTNLEQHTGFVFKIKRDNQEIEYNEPFSLYAMIIVNQLSKLLKFEYKKITRIIYNYYCQNQSSTEHVDGDYDNEFSVIYNPTTTDGGTIILGEKYPDVVSQAKIFKSKWLHSSWPIDKDKARVSINIKFEI